MSTTVIASRFGHELAFASWAARRTIDEEAVREVLGRYGLELLPGLLDRNEVVVAEGLSPTRAVALAQELRAIGLTVDVVNEAGIKESHRVETAYVLNTFAICFTVGVASTSLCMGQPFVAGPMSLAMLLALVNLLVLQWRGGKRLFHVGAVPEPSVNRDLARWEERLRAELPEHVLIPFLERARELESEALRDPEGPAATALAELLTDDEQHRRADMVGTARALREELNRARRAAAEVSRLQ